MRTVTVASLESNGVDDEGLRGPGEGGGEGRDGRCGGGSDEGGEARR